MADWLAMGRKLLMGDVARGKKLKKTGGSDKKRSRIKRPKRMKGR